MSSKFRKLLVSGVATTAGAGIATYLLFNDSTEHKVCKINVILMLANVNIYIFSGPQ